MTPSPKGRKKPTALFTQKQIAAAAKAMYCNWYAEDGKDYEESPKFVKANFQEMFQAAVAAAIRQSREK